ncbi:glycosyltransferase family 117 protein [Reichenbachiella versicolor]|uniref:glycosyltransferase family 117 protein n=1 Tax=Reichenbachiella versicolor TaxID=1821036 RepID=UPI000D6DD74F|nr:DUF2723 domain-containing protein [Reichenbachiella versicolor]
MLNYTKLNNIIGWLVFIAATVVYAMTVEPTASYWDCGEFIAVSYKLEVPHPPGAPFFLLIGRMFSFLAMGDVEQVAYWINMVSVISSGFTILFLFWSITHLAKKLVKEDNIIGNLVVLGSGLVGALAYTFSDSFWFSAVEAEVYGMSSFFTAFVVWAILKWENIEDPASQNRWMIFIAYMVGLSIGVHLLNLVTVPALGLIYYFKKRLEVTVKGVFGALIASGTIIIVIMEGIIPGLPSVAGQIEINFVNDLGLPFGSGIAIFIAAFFGYIIYGIVSTSKGDKLSHLFLLITSGVILFVLVNVIISGSPLRSVVIAAIATIVTYFVSKKNINKTAIIVALGIVPGIAVWYLFCEGTKHEKYIENLSVSGFNTIMLSFAFIIIGYSTYSIVLIRSNYDPPIDENNPEDVLSFVSYLKREQYGSRPLVHGQYFTADVVDQKKGEAVYKKGKEEYEVADFKLDYIYDPTQTTILPRAWSSQPAHAQKYRDIIGLREGEKPSFADNIAFMLKHQLGTMYFRYFMWNFAGRASDIQGAGWLGINDALEEVPAELANNKGRNIYFMIPLLLGIIGLIFQYYKDTKNFAFVAMLFFLTGAAIVLYLNSPPIEPRERDYIYAGSYYAFAFWIGLAVIAIYEGLKKLLNIGSIAAVIAIVIGLTAPTIMAAENWDDHDRSNRYFSVDSAKNFLASCAPNAILFTGGDNDTFPLWYVQEVEGFRTDVRVVVLSYFNTDWYIAQMMRDAYESKPLPFGLTLDNYVQGGLNDYLPLRELPSIKNGMIDARQFIKLIKNEHPALQLPTSISKYNSVPAKKFSLNVDTAAVLAKGIIPEQFADKMVSKMQWSMKGRGLEKKDLAILDLIVNNNWERPIYFNNTSASSVNLNLKQFMVQEGNAFRLLPIKNDKQGMFVDTNMMYDNMMNNFYWRELDNPNVYYSEDYRNFVLNHRASFNTLIENLLMEGDTVRAKQAVEETLARMPDEVIQFDHFSVQVVGFLLELGEKEKADKIANRIGDRANEMLAYLFMKGSRDTFALQKNLVSLNELSRTYRQYNDPDLALKFERMFSQYYGMMAP